MKGIVLSHAAFAVPLAITPLLTMYCRRYCLYHCFEPPGATILSSNNPTAYEPTTRALRPFFRSGLGKTIINH